ncbi:MAG: vitamin K epoxide reductase family protein [Bacteroidetes bacterium]|nr:vitamin K epoxide reductase family protein [Bacteroidota bacterium]
MAAISPIVLHLLRLYGHPATPSQVQGIASPLPDTASLQAIAYFLHQCGVSTIRLFINKTELPELNHPFLLLRTTITGETEALHYHNGKAHTLSPGLEQAADLDEWMSDNQQAEVLAFDGEALQAAKLPPATPRSKAYPFLYAGGILLLIALLGLWAYRISSFPLWQQLLSVTSLFAAFISLILLLKEVGIANTYTRPFCSKTNYLGCSHLISSPLAANKWGISWAALGLTHALTPVLYLLLANPAPGLQLMSMVIWLTAAMVTMLYLIYKMWRLRTYCKLCLLVHSINLIGFVIAVVLFVQSPDTYTTLLTLQPILLFAGIALLTAWLVLSLYLLMHQIKRSAAEKAQLIDLSYGLLQHDPNADEKVLHQLLEQYHPLPLNTTDAEDEKPSLLLVVSLHCTHCAKLLLQFNTDHISEKWQTRILIVVDEHTPAAGTQTLLQALQQPTETPEDRIRLMQDWYATIDMVDKDEAAINLAEYPFCMAANRNILEHLPGIFMAGKKIPTPLGADILDLALFTRLQQLDAQETD